jgi:hypothetical protein
LSGARQAASIPTDIDNEHLYDIATSGIDGDDDKNDFSAESRTVSETQLSRRLTLS